MKITNALIASVLVAVATTQSQQQKQFGPSVFIGTNYQNGDAGTLSAQNDSWANVNVTRGAYIVGNAHANSTITHGLMTRAVAAGTGTYVQGHLSQGILTGFANVQDLLAFNGGLQLFGSSRAAFGYGLYLDVTKDPTAALDTAQMIWVGDLAGKANRGYYQWFDSRGVMRVLEENQQAKLALYNPSFAKYFPGALNFERSIMQWRNNILEFGAEAGGTGLTRGLRLLGSYADAVAYRVGGTPGVDCANAGTVTVSRGLVVGCASPDSAATVASLQHKLDEATRTIDQLTARLAAVEASLAGRR